MGKATKLYQKLASETGMYFDSANMVLCCRRDGFDVMIYAEDKSLPHLLTVHTAAYAPSGTGASQQELDNYKDAQKIFNGIRNSGNDFMVKVLNEPNMKNAGARMNYAMNVLIAFLREHGYAPGCSICGQGEDATSYTADFGYYHLCPKCAAEMETKYAEMGNKKARKKENVVGGIVGAFLGSLLGVLCIVILGQMGYVAAIAGVVMAVGVLKGYELLGGKLTRKGIVICVIVMLVMTYVGDRCDLTYSLKTEVDAAGGMTLFECYRVVPALISEGGQTGAYLANLGLLYVFVLLGAVPTIRSRAKNEFEEGKLVKIGMPK